MQPESPGAAAAASDVAGDEWMGAWGAIEPVPRSVETLCIQIETEVGKPRIYFYPYRTIARWKWSMESPETLEIQAGIVQITISGSGLRRLADALNLGQLRLVQASQPPNMMGEIQIQAVLIEDSAE